MQWQEDWHHNKADYIEIEVYMATQAARWGADQELEACYEWVVRDWTDIQSADMLRATRRPKPPSLKEQALEALKVIECEYVIGSTTGTIRKALEALPND